MTPSDNWAEEAQKNIEKAAEEVMENLNSVPIVSDQDAQDIAKLKNFVTRNKLALEREGKVYLRCEAWQYVIAMKGLTPCFDSAAEVMVSKGANGKDVRQYVVTTVCELKNKEGVTISRSMIMASNQEAFLKHKPLYATWGMSQTRALSRAARNIYGYLAVGAGFQAVPWEELGE